MDPTGHYSGDESDNADTPDSGYTDFGYEGPPSPESPPEGGTPDPPSPSPPDAGAQRAQEGGWFRNLLNQLNSITVPSPVVDMVPGGRLWTYAEKEAREKNYFKAAVYGIGSLLEAGLFIASIVPAATVEGVNLALKEAPPASAPIAEALWGQKDAARYTLSAMDLDPAQLAAANRAISRATTSSTIGIEKEGSDVIVSVSRAGQYGYQVIESTIGPDGTKTVVQKAYDAAGNLVHFHTK